MTSVSVLESLGSEEGSRSSSRLPLSKRGPLVCKPISQAQNNGMENKRAVGFIAHSHKIIDCLSPNIALPFTFLILVDTKSIYEREIWASIFVDAISIVWLFLYRSCCIVDS